MLHRLLAIFGLLGALAGEGVAGAGKTVDATAMFKADAARTGFLPAGPQPPLRIRWTFRSRETRNQIEGFSDLSDGFSPASMHQGVVFVGGHDGWIYALNAKTGKTIWEYQTSDKIVTSPQYAHGLLLAGSKDGFFRALDAKFGFLVWKTRFGVSEWNGMTSGGMRSTPTLYDGKIIMGGCDGVYRAMDERSGKILWETDGGGAGAMSSPALWNGTLFVGHDGLKNINFYALDPDSGEVKWKYPVPTQIFSTPAAADGIVYFHAREDHVYALRAENGSLVWKTPTAPAGRRWDQIWKSPSKSSPAVANGRVFVGIGNDLVALDRGTGRELWRAQTGGNVDSSPLVVGETVYVGSSDNSFYAFSAASGKQTWSFRTGGSVTGSPTSGEGLILIGSNDGTLYAFEAAPRESPPGSTLR